MDCGAECPDESSLRERYCQDVYALGAFLLILTVVLLFRFSDDTWLAEYDIMGYFLPWYGQLGDRLRAFDIPGWMPWLSSGSPLAGDPSGGWWYLPVMLTFPFLEVTAAFKAMVVIQMLVGGVATYILSRLIGLRPVSALVSTVAFVFGPFIAFQMTYGTVAGQVLTWLPVAMLGIECSLRSPRLLARITWWGVAGLGISQIAVSWPGQGLYNALLIIAGWVAYRTLIWPVNPARPFRGRWLDALTTGPAVLLLGLLLGAAGLLPRVQTSGVSDIPNGDYSGVVGGDYLIRPHSTVSLLRDFVMDNSYHRPLALGVTVVVLSALAILIGRKRFGIPFFVLVFLISCVLSTGETPLHRLFYLLPGFENLHTHSPRRVLWPSFIAPAMLAGAGVEAVLSWRPRRGMIAIAVVPLLMVIGAALVLHRDNLWIGWWPLLVSAATTGLVVFLMVVQTRHDQSHLNLAGQLATVAIVALIILYPTGSDILLGRMSGAVLTETDEICPSPSLGTYLARTDPGGAGEYLQSQQAKEPPFRFASYAGRDPSSNDDPSYTYRRCEPEVIAALTGGRSMRLGLESIQGYNPLHLGVYSGYINTMNGGQQNYHWVDPDPSALRSSPLLDMLNVRYIVVALDTPGDQREALAITRGKREVFRDGEVAVFENPNVYPRAWIVHEVRSDNDGDGLQQIADGRADGRTVAFVEGPIPDVAPVRDAGSERVEIIDRDEDSMTASVDANSAGLVVFSEIYDGGWRAWLDGQPVDILRANHALRGVSVPAGTHTIELRYEPRMLRIGLVTSMATGGALAISGTAAMGMGWVNRRKRE